MKTEKRANDTLVFLILPTLFSSLFLIAMSSFMTYAENNLSGLLLTLSYYLTRLVNCVLYFIWCPYIFGFVSSKKASKLFLYLIYFFLFTFFRFCVSYLFMYGDMLVSDTILAISISSFASALFEAMLLLAISLVSCLVLTITRRKCKHKLTENDEALAFSLSSALLLFLFELIMQIITTVSFISEQLGILYPSEVWSIIFDYVFICIVFVIGFFLCSFYTRRNKLFHS